VPSTTANNFAACLACEFAERRDGKDRGCTLDGVRLVTHAVKGDCPKGFHQPIATIAPRGNVVQASRPRGLGDVVARIASAVGIKRCGGCRKRQEALNRAVPFKQ
jgi:hypothetical protein